MQITIDDAQRAEILAAVLDRKTTIATHVKKLTADTMPEEAALCERRLSLYTTQTGAGARVGLVAMFSLAPDLDEEHVKAGEERDPEGQQDIWGGGAATGGGHPEGERGWLGAFGKLYASEALAEASFRTGPDVDGIKADGNAPASAGDDADGADGVERDAAGFKLLPPGDGTVVDAEDVTVHPAGEAIGSERDTFDHGDAVDDPDEALADLEDESTPVEEAAGEPDETDDEPDDEPDDAIAGTIGGSAAEQ